MICRQDQEADSRVEVGTVINLVVSLGLEDIHKDENVTVPKITDLKLEAAKKKLQEVNLYLSVKSEKYDDKPAGTVLSQSVKSGTTVKEGTTVEVVVSKGKETVVVPYVTYKTAEEAERLLKNAKLQCKVLKEYSDSVVKGNVISQSVAAEKKVAPGTTVAIVVSKGKKTVTVPNVVGKKSASAVSAIQEKGLQVTVKEENSSSVAAGNVIRQSPAAMKTVDNGATVTIYISKGQSSAVVASVTGKLSGEGKTTLLNLGFEVVIKEQYSDTVVSGKIISQSPRAGSTLTVGATVTIYVSKGKQKFTVPNVVGLASATATSTLKNSGFKVSSEGAFSNTVPKGKVISQSPAANSVAAQGDTVYITVSKGSETVKVPNVVGKTETAASNAMINAGLKSRIMKESSDTVPAGNVIRQTPAANAAANKGDTVTLYVSKGSETVKVPNVVGKTEAAAKTAIESAGLKSSTVQEFSNTVPAGSVIRQSPAANATASKGDTVTLTVSKGSSSVKVPNVVGKNSDAAESAMMNVGLKCRIVKEYSDTVPTGNVTRQTPAANATASRGDTVTLYISKGSSSVRVPNVVGMSEDAAASSLSNVGLKYRSLKEYSDTVPAGCVIRQTPSANATANKGDTVKLYISKGKESDQ